MGAFLFLAFRSNVSCSTVAASSRLSVLYTLSGYGFHPKISPNGFVIYSMGVQCLFCQTLQELSRCCVSAACARESWGGRKAAKAAFLRWISGRPGAAYTPLPHTLMRVARLQSHKRRVGGVQVEAESSDGCVFNWLSNFLSPFRNL